MHVQVLWIVHYCQCGNMELWTYRYTENEYYNKGIFNSGGAEHDLTKGKYKPLLTCSVNGYKIILPNSGSLSVTISNVLKLKIFKCFQNQRV